MGVNCVGNFAITSPNIAKYSKSTFQGGGELLANRDKIQNYIQKGLSKHRCEMAERATSVQQCSLATTQ